MENTVIFKEKEMSPEIKNFIESQRVFAFDIDGVFSFRTQPDPYNKPPFNPFPMYTGSVSRLIAADMLGLSNMNDKELGEHYSTNRQYQEAVDTALDVLFKDPGNSSDKNFNKLNYIQERYHSGKISTEDFVAWALLVIGYDKDNFVKEILKSKESIDADLLMKDLFGGSLEQTPTEESEQSLFWQGKLSMAAHLKNILTKYDFNVNEIGSFIESYRQRAKNIIEQYANGIFIDTRLVNVLSTLNSQDNFHTIVATNRARLSDEMYKKIGFYNNFNFGLVTSNEINCKKPEEKFFRILIERIRLKIEELILNKFQVRPDPSSVKELFNPSQIFFIDDVDVNVTAAKELGINAIQYTTPAQLLEELRNYQINIEDPEEALYGRNLEFNTSPLLD